MSTRHSWRGTRLAAVASLATIGVVTVGYAADRGAGDGTAPDGSGPVGSLLLDEQLEEGIEIGRDVIDALVASGDEPAFLGADYGGCDTRDPVEAYAEAYGRVDHPDGRSSTHEDVDAGRDLLVEMGWTLRDGGRWEDGVDENRYGWRVASDRGDLSLLLNYSISHNMVLVSVLGPCVPITDEQDDVFGVFEPIRVDIGATSTTTTTPLSTESTES